MLPTSNNVFQWKHFGVLFCWLFSVLASATYFINQQSIAFDPKGQLSSLTGNNVVARIASEHQLLAEKLQIVEFISPDCHCNRVTELHKRKLERFAVQNGVEFQSVEIKASKTITSTPSILVTDEEGELVYFGPVGEGIGCNENTDAVQTAISNYQKGYNPNFINSQTKGCYCNL